ncbi:hypothetical protein K435DRAFT_854446 [Dendrothele bispora CBS 962.96]|uniref:Uncharacterized protein n=1 Tax=Dendrothele bispora (strain CBS 962.96) TaxID=1314807 RepID=A0A4S8MF71_DENBC|nr:hypothetical protein K435DRAFT_854446 [Dendrothele bispora CBS 962.96]
MQITDCLTDYNRDLKPGQVEDTQHFDLRATPDYNTNSDFRGYPENSDQENGGNLHRRLSCRGVCPSVINRLVSQRPPAAPLPGYRESLDDKVVETSPRMQNAFTAAPVFFTEHYAIEDCKICPFFVMDAHFDLESLEPALFQRPDYL